MLNLGAFRAFVRFALVWFCLFPIPLPVWDGLRLVIVALSGLFLTFFRILTKLRWEFLKKRRRLILLYKSLEDAASITTDDLIPAPPHPVPQLGSIEIISQLIFQTERNSIYKAHYSLIQFEIGVTFQI